MIVDINMFKNTEQAVKDYLNEIERMKKEIQDTFIVKLSEDLKELQAKYPNLDKIFVLGSTPEWNDGEECFHDSDVYIANIPDSRSDDMYEYVDRIYYNEDQVPDEFLSVNVSLSESEVQGIKAILRTADFEEFLQQVFDTDFHIIIDLTSDIKVTVKPYECGY